MFNFLLQALALRFLIFDYKFSPVQIFLQTATNPILKTLTGCIFCQGCEAGFIVGLIHYFAPAWFADLFLNGISAGFVAMEFANWVNGKDDFVFDEDADFIVVEEEP